MMAGVKIPDFSADIRITIDDGRVDYAFGPAPGFNIALRGRVSQARRDVWPLGAQAQILFGGRFEGKSLVMKDNFLSAACPSTPEDTARILDLIRMAQTRQGGLLIDIDVGAKPSESDPDHWFVTDVSVMLPNLLS
jgi:hypothetical protein